ncbi:hypothetical protein Tco_0415488 [Tanacetum coccineum]
MSLLLRAGALSKQLLVLRFNPTFQGILSCSMPISEALEFSSLYGYVSISARIQSKKDTRMDGVIKKLKISKRKQRDSCLSIFYSPTAAKTQSTKAQTRCLITILVLVDAMGLCGLSHNAHTAYCFPVLAGKLRRGPEFTWEREDQFRKKYPHLFTKTASSSMDWKSSKQSTAAMSATEAEYIADSEALIEVVWIRKFISELGKIRFLKVHTDDNLADHFTKALPKGKLTQHARSMGLRLASSFM